MLCPQSSLVKGTEIVRRHTAHYRVAVDKMAWHAAHQGLSMAPVELTCGDALETAWGSIDLVFINNFLVDTLEIVSALIHKANVDPPGRLLCARPLGVDTATVYLPVEPLDVPESARNVSRG